MTASFQQRQLRVTFTLGSGANSFQGGANQLVLTGLRTLATISGAFQLLSQLDLQVYGMAAQDMNALSVITVPGKPTAILKNLVLLEGNQGNGWYTLFDGLIVEAGPEYRGSPEAFFRCQAIPSAYFLGKAPAQPLSYPNGAQVSDVASTISGSMGSTLSNNGVGGSVPKGAYLAGAPLDQLDSLHAYSGESFNWTVDPNNSLTLVPAGKPRTGGTKLVLTPDTGLIGYPAIEVYGIAVVALFDPALLLGNQFQIQGSDIPAANGDWFAYGLTYQLEALQFGGHWFASMHCQQAIS